MLIFLFFSPLFFLPSPLSEARSQMRAATFLVFLFSFAAFGSSIADAGGYLSRFSFFLRRFQKPDHRCGPVTCGNNRFMLLPQIYMQYICSMY